MVKSKGSSLAITHPDIAAQWHPTMNGGLSPQDVTYGSNKKVWWVCHKCSHEWKTTVGNRVGNRSRPHGCPVCANRIIRAGYNDLATTHPDIAAQWHPTMNGSLTPQDVTFGSQKRVWWLCHKCGHEWAAVIGIRCGVWKTGCPVCMSAQRKDSIAKWHDCRCVVGKNDLATARPEIAAQWHPTKNNGLSPQNVTHGSNKKVWWLCDKCGHEWAAMVNSRSQGCGCPACAGRVARVKTADE